MAKSPFAVGRRWRCVKKPEDRGRCRVFDFVVIGPGTDMFVSEATRKRYKRFRIECQCPVEDKRGHFHLAEADYSHAHVKKYAVLVEE